VLVAMGEPRPRASSAGPNVRALERLIVALTTEPAPVVAIMPRVLRALGRTFGYRCCRAVLLRDDGLLHVAYQWNTPERRTRPDASVIDDRKKASAPGASMSFALVALGRAIGCIELRNAEPGAQTVNNVTPYDSLGRHLGGYLRLASLEERLADPDPTRGRRAGLFDWQPHSDTAYFSPAFLSLLGWPAEHRVDRGDFLRDAIHPEDLASFRDAVEQHLGQDEALDLPCRLRDAQGRYRTFRLRGIAVRNGSGDCIRLFGSIVRRGRPTSEPIAGTGVADRTVAPAVTGHDLAPDEDAQSMMFCLAHTIEEPLRAVDGIARHLRDLLESRGLRDELDLANRVRATIGRTLADVERLVELSVGGRESLRPVTVDLSAMARTILGAPRPDERPPVVEVAPGLVDAVDPGLIRTVLDLLADAGCRRVGSVWRIRFARIEGIDPSMYSLEFDGDGPAHEADASPLAGAGLALAAATRALARQGGRLWTRWESHSASIAFTLCASAVVVSGYKSAG
jgi:PAS domain-containing protein